MADTQGQADIRNIDIDKLVKGFADEPLVLKGLCTVSDTSAREIRWVQKTAGFLDNADTTAITATSIITSSKSIPVVAEPTWTKNTSYVKFFKLDSPWLSTADIKDNIVDMLGTFTRDVTRGVQRQVEQRIYDVLTEASTSGTPNPTNVNTAAATADGWNDTATGDPIADINTGIKNIRTYSYGIDNIVLYINEAEEMHLKNFLISVKGSSIPQFASSQVSKNKIMEILGCQVLVSNIATTDWAVMLIPQKSLTWKQFTPITGYKIIEPGIGVKVRVVEEGECLLTDTKSVHIISDTIV